jgi:hypothetical protein
MEGQAIGPLAEAARKVCLGQFSTAVKFANGVTFPEGLRAVASGDVLIPIAAYFMTYLTISIMFYFGVGLTIIGLRLNGLLGVVFRSEILSVESNPFTFLGALSFVLFGTLFVILKLFIAYAL